MKRFHYAWRNKLATLVVCLMTGACVLNAKTFNDDFTYTCANAEHYRGQVVGDGHCVSLIKKCSAAPQTAFWRAGSKVLGNYVKPGTVIATFRNGRYPNRSGYHAAIYIKQDERGIWVWDQWVGKAVHKRLIRKRSDRATAANTAQHYRVVKR